MTKTAKPPAPRKTAAAAPSEGARAELAKAGFARLMDLLLHFPLRYENWQDASPLANLRNGETALVEGEITDAQIVYVRNRARNLLVAVGDETGATVAMRFFRLTPALENSMRIGRRVRARGVVRMGRVGWEMSHPQLQSAMAPAEMVAVYPAIGKLPQAEIRRLIAAALEKFDGAETVDGALRKFTGGGFTAKAALQLIHAPPAEEAEKLMEREHPAWRRLRFDELLAHHIVLRRRYRRRLGQTATALSLPPRERFIARLPFSPTAAQEKAMKEIAADIGKTTPMRRLLQGDVGSGKTLVAAAACLACAEAGRTAALMAPTGILARQHFETLSEWFAPIKIQCELLTAETRGKKRSEAESRLQFGISHIAVGTHALFQEKTNLPKLALAVADEQHRFGVEQRLALTEKSPGGVHQLMMSATPIPRTLAMSVFADLDVSILDEKPPGRAPVQTVLISAARRAEVLARIAERQKQGGRAFWICPRVSESESAELQNAREIAAEAGASHPPLNPKVVHGKMKAAEKESAMDDFRNGKTGLLVATTVVEVGVDVPEADVMVIDNAGRMGLSQLHQLRGRVGRGGKEGFCVLLYDEELSEAAKERLKILRDSDDGFAIARRDLQLRGPGEWLGLRQSGMPALRAAKLAEDNDIIRAARNAADQMLTQTPRLAFSHVHRWFGKNFKLARV